ncbi:serine/threonine protein phosphatase [Halovibrio salipaludis]|uniref:Serine/threonine protein phosphatase n=1 Tax=Halovibrio salipaludis TaxID=2032626 RepID=A0A2A2F4T5_9GAMM|nr:metallophosphoesterase [Halovibrio salipaludis]PAU79639.1 serine/threonine protein phosphatase [Halovibrio salipaludis]
MQRHLLPTTVAVTLTVFSVGVLASQEGIPEEADLRFAVIGDAEPKPDPEFPGLEAAVDSINELTGPLDLAFVGGVGDIPHDGTVPQYEASLSHLETLSIPFYPIMGNEEFTATEERFLEYATRWNQGEPAIESVWYTIEEDDVAFIFATPDRDGRDFSGEGIDWIESELEALGGKPAMLFIHGAPRGVFPEGGDKGVRNPDFSRLFDEPNLVATFSGDLHVDIERVESMREKHGVHHIQVPPLERTKVPDELRHHPYYRIVSVKDNGEVVVSTYNLVAERFEPEQSYRFDLKR